MNAERLKQIEEIYHSALENSPDEQADFIAKRCGDDEELHREVESLLALRSSSEKFLKTPPESLAAEMFAEQDRNDLIGKKIKHYEICGLLGAGGMGEVYLAEDTKLRRKIALKILPRQFSTDDERRNRFVKEARAISALNHPNIITIYEIEDGEELNFIATEFIDGQTLRERITENPISWQEAVKIAIQISGALESAHLLGIVHRDIKPANIMIRKDGLVKVLDFGLAKLTAPDSGEFLSRDQTAPHRVMGTINYMSPEQALGEQIDARTDIFSFGVVLYEMLSGKTPFAGESDGATYNATINKTATSLSELNGEIPDALNRIVRHALEKKREARYQNFTDFRNDLKKLLSDPHTASFDYAFTDENALKTDSGKTPPTESNDKAVTKSKFSPVWLIAPLLIFGLAFGVYWKYFSASENSPVSANQFQSIKLDVLTAHGLAYSVAISPDGKYIAYAKEEDGKQSLWLRQTSIAGDTQIVAPGNVEYDYLKFSPDGDFIYFVGTGGDNQPSSLFKLTTLGRNQQKIIENVDSQFSLSPDGKNIAFLRIAEGNYSIVIADEQGKNERVLISRKHPNAYIEDVSWSPDGKLIASPTMVFGATYAAGIAVIDVETGEEKQIPLKAEKLLRISKAEWVNDGKGLIFLTHASDMGGLYQLRYADFPGGEVQNVTNDLSSYEDFSLTADDQTLVAVQREYSMGIWVTSENDFTNVSAINSKTGADDGEWGLYWTNDGKLIYVTSEGGGQNIWRMDTDGSNPKPLTTGYKYGKFHPTIASESGLITYLSRAVDPVTQELITGWTFFQMDSEGQNARQVVEKFDAALEKASANKDWLVYTSREGGKFRLWRVPLNGGEPLKLTDVESHRPAISPDGKSVAYFITEDGEPLKIGIISIDGEPLKKFEVPATTNTNSGIAWNKDGDGILFVNKIGTTSNVWIQPLDGKQPKPLTDFKEFQIAQFALNSIGNRLAVSRGSRNRNVVVVKNLRY